MWYPELDLGTEKGHSGKTGEIQKQLGISLPV